MTDNTQPESGSTHIIRYALELGLLWVDGDGRDKVREALDALDTLESQLEAIGAGVVSGPLMGRASPQSPSFDAADMATTAAQGFRDGVASVAANAGSEPGASRAFLERALSAMEGVIDVADRNTTEFDALRSCVVDLTLMLFKPQACHPSPPEGMAVWTKLRGQRMVLCSLLGECLPVIDALMQMPGDDDSDARLNGLAGRIIGALDAIAEDQVKGGES